MNIFHLKYSRNVQHSSFLEVRIMVVRVIESLIFVVVDEFFCVQGGSAILGL